MSSLGTIVIADLETTHRDVDKAGACQVAAVAITMTEGQLPVMWPIFQTYCQPSERMSPEALAVHGITPDKYAYSPTDAAAIWVLRSLINALPQPVILSGYNCTRYDYQLMDKIYPEGKFSMLPQIDVMTLMMRKDPDHGLKLTEVFERMFPGNPLLAMAHDAMADCHMTSAILNAYMQEYQAFDPSYLSRYCSMPMPLQRMPWGKYKGRLMDDVPVSYMRWCAANWDDMHPDMAAAFKLRGYLR